MLGLKQVAIGLLLGVTMVVATSTAWARPEFALRNGVVSCTSCHASPVGGGIRNLNGKMYASQQLGYSQFSTQDFYQVDFRGLVFIPERPQNTRYGLGLMSAMPSVNVPVVKSEFTSTSIVASYDLGVFQPGLRDAYVLWTRESQLLKNVIFGRFNVPFGLLSDEHRTYVRMQTQTTYNNYYGGLMLSGNPLSSIHYDLGVLNGFQSSSAAEGGGSFSTGPTWGQVANLRWIPVTLPVMLGASESYMSRHSGQPDPSAYSVYGGISLDRLTNNLINGTMLVEYVTARHWNDTNLNSDLSRRIVADTGFLNAVKDKQSQGLYAQLTYRILPRLTLLYKYDQLALDDEFIVDSFVRHGLGIKHYASSNMTLQLRAEVANAGHPELPSTNPGAQDAYWLLLHLWM